MTGPLTSGLRLLGLAATFCAMIPTSVRAQDGSTTMVVKTFSTTSVFAPPPWGGGSDPMQGSEIFRQQGRSANKTDTFVLEFIPKGQKFEAWQELYAIYAETPVRGQLSAFRNGQAAQYVKACKEVTVHPIVDRRDSQIFVIYCTAYVDKPAQGEIAVMHFRLKNRTLVKNYYHRRGPAFRLDDPKSMPLSIAELSGVIRRLQAFRLESARN